MGVRRRIRSGIWMGEDKEACHPQATPGRRVAVLAPRDASSPADFLSETPPSLAVRRCSFRSSPSPSSLPPVCHRRFIYCRCFGSCSISSALTVR